MVMGSLRGRLNVIACTKTVNGDSLIILCHFSFYYVLVQDQEIMLPTSHHGGQLTRTPRNRKAGEIVSRVYFQYFYFIAHVLHICDFSAYYCSPQCLNKGGPGAVCGMVSDQSYDFPLSGVNTPL